MIDSAYYYQNILSGDEIGSSIELNLTGPAKSSFLFFINGVEVDGFSFSFDEESKRITLDTGNLNEGDVVEGVRIVPTLQPYILNSEDDFDIESLNYQTASFRLLLEQYSTSFAEGEQGEDLLTAFTTGEEFLVRIKEWCDENLGDFVVGDIYPEGFDRFDNFFKANSLTLYSFIDIALQREGRLANPESPKFLISRERLEYEAVTTDKNPAVYTFHGRYGEPGEEYYFYHSFDAPNGNVRVRADNKALIRLSGDSLTNDLLYPNVFKDSFFATRQSLREQTHFEKSDTGKVSIVMPFDGSIDLRKIYPRFLIDGGSTSIAYGKDIKIVEDETPDVTQEKRRFSLSRVPSDISIALKTYMLTNPSLAGLDNLNPISRNVEEFPETLTFPDISGYPLIEFKFQSELDLLDIVPYVYGMFPSPFVTDASTFNLIVIQSGKSFGRSFGLLNEEAVRENGKWKGKIAKCEGLDVEASLIDVEIPINGEDGDFEGRFYFERGLQVINDGEDLTGDLESRYFP